MNQVDAAGCPFTTPANRKMNAPMPDSTARRTGAGYTASKKRLQWNHAPPDVRAFVENVAGSRVARAVNCEGGYSPGLAARLVLDDGRMVFAKAIDARAWPDQAIMYRAEVAVSSALPLTVPAPRLLGSLDDGHWVVLVFQNIDGREPDLRSRPADAAVVTTGIGELSRALTPSPIALGSDHPRLGGWMSLAGDSERMARLPAHSQWASRHVGLLAELETTGLAAAQGKTLVHFDAYPHNILLTGDRVLFVDWPHARLGAPFLDLLMFLTSVSADGIDPEPIVASHVLTSQLQRGIVDGVLAAIAGFLVCDSLYPAPPGLEPIIQAKMRIGLGALGWLERRLGTIAA
jgi:hypothetical protein